MKRSEEQTCPLCKGRHTKRPAFQFYAGDWLRDPSLRSCSLAARGLWVDMLCFMHQACRRGFLVVGLKPVTSDMLARMVGEALDTTQVLQHELREAGVFSETDSGVIYSRRMVRDEAKSKTNTTNGENGGNPNLVRTSLLSGSQVSLLEPDAVVNPTINSGRKEDSVNRLSTDSVRDSDNRAPEEEEEDEEGRGLKGEGSRGGGIDEFGEPTWRTRQPVRLPEDFYVTRKMREAARAKGVEHDGFLEWETDKLRNWASNVSGVKGSKPNWGRAWLNWIMRAIEEGEYERWKRRNGAGGAPRPGGGGGAAGWGSSDPYSAEAIAARRNRGRGDGNGSGT